MLSLPSAQESIKLLISAISQGSIYGLVGIGFSLVYNATGVINFAQGEFVMLGGVCTYLALAFLGLPLWGALSLSILVTGASGFAIQQAFIGPLRRRRAPAFSYAFALFGVSIILSNLVLVLVGSESLSIPQFSAGSPLHLGTAEIPRQTLWLVGTTAVVTIALGLFWRWSRLGRAMRAASMDPFAARLVGIPVERMVAYAYFMSAIFGAVAGAVSAPLTLTGYNVGLAVLIKGFVAAILGGFGNVFGAIVGALFLSLTESFATYIISSTYRDVISFTVMIAVLLFLPQGLFGRSHTATEDI